MRFHRATFLPITLALTLVFAILGNSAAPLLAADDAACASHCEDTKSPEKAPDEGPHCPCTCHHATVAVLEWKAPTALPLLVIASVAELAQSIVEAPRAPIDYPPQLA